jgi:hypothetical protein
MARAKTLVERFLNKTIILPDRSELMVMKVDEDSKVLMVSTFENSTLDPSFVNGISVNNVEARGGKFWYNNNTTTERKIAMETAENSNGVTAQVKNVMSTAEEVTVKPVEVKDGVEVVGPTVDGIADLVCQFCGHKFSSKDENSFVRPEVAVDICSGCISMAEDRLLMAGVPGYDIIPKLVMEYLLRFYGMVNTDLVIAIPEQGQVQPTETTGCCTECICDTSPAEVVDTVNEVVSNEVVLKTPVEAFLAARLKVAATICETIQSLNAQANIDSSDNEDAYVKIIFAPFDFHLTALCGGFIVKDEIVDEEFCSLDDLLSYFADSTSTVLGYEDEAEEDLDDEDEDTIVLPIGTFYRLQNCVKEENNKKLVKIIETIIPEGDETQVVYRVQDKAGKKYKVTEDKLKPSIKEF